MQKFGKDHDFNTSDISCPVEESRAFTRVPYLLNAKLIPAAIP